MGWIILAFLAASSFALLWSLRVPRLLWSFVGAALMLGAAGYATQGRPALAGQAAAPMANRADRIDPSIVALRLQMFGRFQYADSYFFVADALGRSGNHRGAVRALLGGVRSAPQSLPLWTWLGVALVQADGDTMSPAAEFAFRRARVLNPEHPAPWFFQGLGYARSGEFDRVRRYWVRALQVSGPTSQYRPEIAARIEALDQFLAIRDRMQDETRGMPPAQ